jgi:hypothetical protein
MERVELGRAGKLGNLVLGMPVGITVDLSMRAAGAASALLLVSALWWAGMLAWSATPWGEAAATVLAGGAVLAAGIALVGIMVDHSRLAHRLALAVISLELMVAVLTPLSAPWMIGVVIALAAGLGLSGTFLRGWIRGRPSATPAPPQAVGLILLLLATPVAAAYASVDSDPGATLPALTALAWLATLYYARGWPGALATVRIGLPMLAAIAIFLPPLVGLVWSAGVGAAALLSWTAAVRLAVRPLVEKGRAVPIPPELVPEEVLHTAGLNRRGRRS